MGVLSRLMEPFKPKALSSHQLAELMGQDGYTSDSGAVVTPDQAMRLVWFYRGVRILSESIAQLPLILYRRLQRGKERATDHWLYRLLHDQPNPWQTSFEFREMLQAHVTVTGMAYAIKTVVRNEIRELLPVPPWRVEVETAPDGWSPLYWVTMPNGQRLLVPRERMFVVPGLAFNGSVGLSVLSYQREVLGLGLQLTKSAARMFRNGAQLGVVVQHPQRMSDEAYKRLKDSFDAEYSGASNAHKTVLLEEGATAQVTGMKASDAQLLESRQFNRGEIAAMLGIQPHKLGDYGRATWSNVEQAALEHVTDTLGPWLTRWEQRIRMQLIPEQERDTLFAEHLVEGLLRGDFKTRTSGYQTAIATGWMNRNEVREKENMNPGPPELDEFLTPVAVAQPSEKSDAPESARS